ncbi:MAG TPA: outer membrane beta-barrel protein [Chitinophagaceae bacterium]|nr:outer membrane beta-barrel protein [Chitinophagaceae bacterium]HNF70811.1 outer membrane beta-barrel protein [Chitinophagaceae bacterium]
MKLRILSLLIISIHSSLWAQKTGEKDQFSMPSRDYVMLQLGYDSWLNAPDSIQITGLGRSLNGYLCYDFPILKSNFSFAAGVGIGTSNIYFKDQEVLLADTTSAIQFVPETQAYKKYKLNATYIEAPFELRFSGNKENRNKGFKAAVGLRVGTLAAAHTKGKRTYNNKPITEKVNTKRYLDSWRYAATLRLGYGNVSLFGAYQLNGLFRSNSGPEDIRPFSVGICLSGL